MSMLPPGSWPLHPVRVTARFPGGEMSSDMGAHVAGTVLNSLGIRARNSTHLHKKYGALIDTSSITSSFSIFSANKGC